MGLNKCIYLAFAGILVLMPALGQELGTISYVMNTPNGDLSSTLYFDQENSLFIIGEDEIASFEENQEVDSDDPRKTLINYKVKNPSDLFVWKDERADVMVSSEILLNGTIVLVDDEFPEHSWELHSEKKTILNLNCQRATVKFRCNTYDVYFATEFSASVGPWKLHGLPGPILEAISKTSDYSFKALSIKYPSINSIALGDAPKSSLTDKYSYMKYAELQKVEIEKIRLYLNQQVDGEDGSFFVEMLECF